MIDKSNSRQVDVLERVRISVSNGLKTCSETFAMLWSYDLCLLQSLYFYSISFYTL